MLFIMLIFAILGTQSFNGLMENRCRLTPKPEGDIWVADRSYEYLCRTDLPNQSSGCPDGLFCGNPSTFGLPPNYIEDDVPSLYYGYPTFDNLIISTFTIFQCYIDGWSNTATIYSEAHEQVFVYIFFVTLMILM